MERDPRLVLSRSWTTRRPRPLETEDDYAFVDRATFLERAKAGGFLEWATVLGEYYGSPSPEVAEGEDLVLEIDVQGAEQVLERTRGDCAGDVRVILLLPPSREEQETRLRGRGDSEDHVRRRLELGDVEVERGAAHRRPRRGQRRPRARARRAHRYHREFARGPFDLTRPRAG